MGTKEKQSKRSKDTKTVTVHIGGPGVAYVDSEELLRSDIVQRQLKQFKQLKPLFDRERNENRKSS